MASGMQRAIKTPDAFPMTIESATGVQFRGLGKTCLPSLALCGDQCWVYALWHSSPRNAVKVRN